MTNSPLLKISVVGLLLKVAITGLVAFSIFGLLLQFIFSYMNQSIHGPRLTILNFAGPLISTIIIIVIAAIRILSNSLGKPGTLNMIAKTIWLIFLCILLGWQTWYIITYYEMKSSLDFIDRVTELLPMVTGLSATLFLAVIIFRHKHSS